MFVLNMRLDNWKLIACRDYMNYPLHGWNIYVNTWFFLGQVLRKYKGLRTLDLVIFLHHFRAFGPLCNCVLAAMRTLCPGYVVQSSFIVLAPCCTLSSSCNVLRRAMTICSQLKLRVVVFFWIIPPHLACRNNYRTVILSWQQNSKIHDSNITVCSVLGFRVKWVLMLWRWWQCVLLLSAFCFAIAPIFWLLLAVVALF